jgi:hypothetical protein
LTFRLCCEKGHHIVFRRRQRFPWILERLEARSVPSMLTVTSAADDGSPGTLRATIAAAHSNDTISFAAPIDGQTITLTLGNLAISQDLDIEGPGSDRLTISGNHASQVLAIAQGATVTLAGLTIANGQAVTGAGIDNAGVLTLRDCTLANNQAQATATAALPNGGGGLLNEPGASLVLEHSTVTGNVANAFNNTVDVFGGGVLNEGSATVRSCLFSGNAALGGGGGSFFGGSEGGGIDNYGGATLMVSGSSFVNNQAVGLGFASFGIGGAIENNAGLSNTSPSTATITDCVFTGNQAGGPTSAGNGGAVDNEGTGAMMTLSNSTLSDNRGGPGGGLMNFSGSTLNVIDCSLTGNLVVGQGVGAEANGGGIENLAATMTIRNSRLTNNVAIGGPGAHGNGIGGDAGLGAGGGILNTHGTLTISSSTLTGNQAIGGPDGNISAYPLNGTGEGGGIISGMGSTLTISDCTLAGNVARGGAVTAGVGSPGYGGGILNESTLMMMASTLAGNMAAGGSGSAGGGYGTGGGLEDTASGGRGAATASIAGSCLMGNEATGGAGGAGAVGGNGLGGGIDTGFEDLILSNVTAPSSVTITSSNLDHNVAQGGNGGSNGQGGDGFGGGLAVQTGSQASASATVQAGILTQNQAAGGLAGTGGSAGRGDGGGVYYLGTFSADSRTIIAQNLPNDVSNGSGTPSAHVTMPLGTSTIPGSTSNPAPTASAVAANLVIAGTASSSDDLETFADDLVTILKKIRSSLFSYSHTQG